MRIKDIKKKKKNLKTLENLKQENIKLKRRLSLNLETDDKDMSIKPKISKWMIKSQNLNTLLHK